MSAVFAKLIAELFSVFFFTATKRAVEDWRKHVALEELSSEQQRVFLEIVVAAILEDGKQSDVERKWLERRKAKGFDESVIDHVLAVVTASLPKGSTGDDYEAFVKDRKKALESDDVRRRAFESAVHFLLLADPNSHREGKSWRMARRFGKGLGIGDALIDETLRAFGGGPQTIE